MEARVNVNCPIPPAECNYLTWREDSSVRLLPPSSLRLFSVVWVPSPYIQFANKASAVDCLLSSLHQFPSDLGPRLAICDGHSLHQAIYNIGLPSSTGCRHSQKLGWGRATYWRTQLRVKLLGCHRLARVSRVNASRLSSCMIDLKFPSLSTRGWSCQCGAWSLKSFLFRDFVCSCRELPQ
jgi:hypothetical protein